MKDWCRVVRIAFLFVPILALSMVSCNKDNGEDIPKNYVDDSGVVALAYEALKKAGISLDDVTVVLGSNTSQVEITSDGDGIHYYQVCAIKGNTAYIYLLKYTVQGQGVIFSMYTDDRVSEYKYVKTYSFPVPSQKEIVIDHGYGEKSTLPFMCPQFVSIITNGNNFYGSLVDLYGSRESGEMETVNPRFLIDNAGSVKTVAHALVTEDIPTGGLVGYDYSLWECKDGSIICGAYCYSKTGERLFQTSAWCPIYSSSVDYAAYGRWCLPLDGTKFLVVAFEQYSGKADAHYAVARVYVSDARIGDSEYTVGIPLSDEANVYSPSKFVSEKNGIFTFSMDATLYSGVKKTFVITIDAINQTYKVE